MINSLKFKINKRNKFMEILIFFQIILMFTVPNNMMKIKMINIAILLGISAIYILKKNKKIRLSKFILIWFILYIIMSFLSLVVSLVNQNPGAFNFFNINIIEPIIYFMFILVISNAGYTHRIIDMLVNVTIIIGAYNLIYTIIINTSIVMSESPIFNYIDINIGGMNMGFIKFTSQNLASLMFLTPFVISLFFISKDKKMKNKSLIALILGGMSAVFSVRTAYILVIVITPILIVVLLGCVKLSSKQLMRRYKEILKYLTLCIAIAAVGVVILNIDMTLIVGKVINSFVGSETVNELGIVDLGSEIRVDQMKDLIETWKFKPLFGWGDGANALNVIRSDVDGAYELTYVAMLMQRGIVGIIAYFAQIVVIIHKLIEVSKKNKDKIDSVISVLVGWIAYLIANATNPYMHSLDLMALFFIPLLVINTYDTSREIYKLYLD